MAFSLPSDLSTSWVDDSSTITAGDWNNIAGMGNAIKAAIATLGFSSAKSTVAATETTSSTSYTDLTTTTDQVTVPIGAAEKPLVIISCGVNNASPNGYEGVFHTPCLAQTMFLLLIPSLFLMPVSTAPILE